MSRPLHYQSLMSVAKQLRLKELSARALTEHMLARIDALDGELLSYATVTRNWPGRRQSVLRKRYGPAGIGVYCMVCRSR